jgi:hypothetical protein
LAADGGHLVVRASESTISAHTSRLPTPWPPQTPAQNGGGHRGLDFDALLAKVVYLQQELLLTVRGEVGVGLQTAGVVRDDIQGQR